jgi:hypothetical protein
VQNYYRSKTVIYTVIITPGNYRDNFVRPTSGYSARSKGNVRSILCDGLLSYPGVRAPNINTSLSLAEAGRSFAIGHLFHPAKLGTSPAENEAQTSKIDESNQLVIRID